MRSVILVIAVLAVTLGHSHSHAASPAENTELVAAINTYRASPQACNGSEPERAAPLAIDQRLTRLDAEAQTELRDALREVAYKAAAVQVINASGPPDVDVLMEALVPRFCELLLNPQFTEIGVSRSNNHWQLVLARPLLDEDLGDWQEAGKQLLTQVNQARAESRRCGAQLFEATGELSWNQRLATTALAHSQDMANFDYFAHEGRDGSQVSDRASRAGYLWQRIGENLAAGQGSTQQAVAGWLDSPVHCANLMNPNFREMGAAYAINPDSKAISYWTQVFGTPR